jgi:Restriction endonuclease
MANNKSYKKGKDLEDNLKILEDLIISSNPELSKSDFVIKTRKRIRNREIDIYVECNQNNSDRKNIYIYECKNWVKPVGPDQVDSLAWKVKLSNATKGFMVANKITKGAIKDINNSKKLEYIKFDQEIQLDDPSTFCNSITMNEKYMDLVLIFDGSIMIANNIIEILSKQNKINLAEMLTKKADENIQLTNPNPPSGESWLRYDFTFEPEFELKYNNIFCKQIRLYGKYKINCIKEGITAQFNFHTKGKVTNYKTPNVTVSIVKANNMSESVSATYNPII